MHACVIYNFFLVCPLPLLHQAPPPFTLVDRVVVQKVSRRARAHVLYASASREKPLNDSAAGVAAVVGAAVAAAGVAPAADLALLPAE